MSESAQAQADREIQRLRHALIYTLKLVDRAHVHVKHARALAVRAVHERIHGERARSDSFFQEALSEYDAALERYPFAEYPQLWILATLGIAETILDQQRIYPADEGRYHPGEQQRRLAVAIDCCRDAATASTPRERI